MWVTSELTFFSTTLHSFGPLNFGPLYKHPSSGNRGARAGKLSTKCTTVLSCNATEMRQMCRYSTDFLRMLFISVYVHCVAADTKTDIGFGFD